MNKEKFLRESFEKRFGKKLGSRRVILNVLLNLTAEDNIRIIENSLVFGNDKITLNIEKTNDNDENIIGKIGIYDSYKYYYVENNNSENTYLGFSHDSGNCQLKYKSIYDDFSVEKDMNFKLYKGNNDILYMSNNLCNCPLSECYPHLKEQIEANKAVSRNIGLLISDDMYKFFDYNIKLEQKQSERKNLEQRIYNRFYDAYSNENIDDDMKIRNEMAIVYDLVNQPNISLSSINFQGKEGFNKYTDKELSNCIEVNIERNENGETYQGTYLINGGKYVKYNDDRLEVNYMNNSLYYVLTYNCDVNNCNYMYKLEMSCRDRSNDTGLIREYISLVRTDGDHTNEIIPRIQTSEYPTDKSIYYHIGELISGRYAKVMEEYINGKEELKGKKRNR